MLIFCDWRGEPVSTDDVRFLSLIRQSGRVQAMNAKKHLLYLRDVNANQSADISETPIQNQSELETFARNQLNAKISFLPLEGNGIFSVYEVEHPL